MSNCIANEKNRQRHVLRRQQSNVQPDLRMHVCEHSICFLQHQVCSVLDKRNTIGFEIKETNAVSVKKKVLSLTSKLSSVEDVNVSVNKKKE
ncbi:hypothetical protein TNCV_2158091 [Trichonephila clavipes]|nr:hypothetical protein TNCV_2158091 [Trichonephila clavipes]